MSKMSRLCLVLGAASVLIAVQFQLRSLKPAISTTLAAAQSEYKTVEVSTVGVDTRAQAPVVLLRQPETGQVLPVWVGLAEAQAIVRALHGITTPRPMTHDLMAALLTELQATVKEVVIRDFRDGIYFGMIHLEVPGGAQDLEVDSRPSDAMALALRVGSPIRVATRILDNVPDFDFVAPDENEQVVRAIGITVVASTASVRREFNLPDRSGVVISAVTPEVEALGLRRGDLVVSVGDSVPGTPVEFFDAVRRSRPGDSIRLVIWRDGEERTFEIPVTGTPAEPGRSLTV